MDCNAYYIFLVKPFILIEDDKTKTVMNRIKYLIENPNSTDYQNFNKNSEITDFNNNLIGSPHFFFDKHCYHINSGGFNTIFRLNHLLCAKILLTNTNEIMFYEELHELVPQEYYKYFNIPLKTFNDVFLYKIYRAYFINLTMFLYLSGINFKSDFLVYIIEKNKNSELMKSIIKRGHENKNINAVISILYKALDNCIIINNYMERFYNLISNLITTKDYSDMSIPDNIDNLLYTYLDAEILNNKPEEIKQEVKKKILDFNPNLSIFFGSVTIQKIALGNAYSLGYNNAVDGDNKILLTLTIELYLIMYILNTKYGFVHSDLKPDNILIYPNYKKKIKIVLDDKYYFIFNINFKINDFDLSRFDNKNKKVKREYKKNINSDLIFDLHFWFYFMSKWTKFNSYSNLLYDNLFYKFCKKCTEKNKVHLCSEKVSDSNAKQILYDFFTKNELVAPYRYKN